MEKYLMIVNPVNPDHDIEVVSFAEYEVAVSMAAIMHQVTGRLVQVSSETTVLRTFGKAKPAPKAPKSRAAKPAWVTVRYKYAA